MMYFTEWKSIYDELPRPTEFVWVKTNGQPFPQLAYYSGKDFKSPHSAGIKKTNHTNRYIGVEYWTELIPPIFIVFPGKIK